MKALRVAADGKEIVHGATLSVREGETVVLSGKNGSGKSTLAGAIMGMPGLSVVSGEVRLCGEDLLKLRTDERARKGVFLSFQAPVEIPGVPLSSFLRASIAGRDELTMKRKEFRKRIRQLADELDMDRTPHAAAPQSMLMDATSFSPWMNVPPRSAMWADMYCRISLCGVMG